MKTLMTALCAIAIATPAFAEMAPIRDRAAFIDLVNGKELTRPMVNLTVTPDGSITGMGVTWEVSGNWSWKDGYFCRDLFWGGDSLGYNCQEVRSNGNRIQFTSDRGTGDSAAFRLR